MTTCGFIGAKVELHGVHCETVSAMVALIPGRAMHQTLTVSAEGRNVTWTCTKPTRSLYAPLRCGGPRQRSFTISFESQ